MLLFKIQVWLIAAFASSASERSKGTEETKINFVQTKIMSDQTVFLINLIGCDIKVN